MILPSDIEYQDTKNIKLNNCRLKPPFDDLANWISSTYDVTVLNIIYERKIKIRNIPRLNIILEQRKDVKKFRDQNGNYDCEKQNSIIMKFFEFINLKPQGLIPKLYTSFILKSDYVVDGLFVVFSAFAPIALIEADNCITEQNIQVIKKRINNPDLWEITRFFPRITFMFYTDEQVKAHEKRGFLNEYRKIYFDFLKPHDEFDYLTEQDLFIVFDSKQNFDDNFKSNWFYYYK